MLNNNGDVGIVLLTVNNKREVEKKSPCSISVGFPDFLIWSPLSASEHFFIGYHMGSYWTLRNKVQRIQWCA